MFCAAKGVAFVTDAEFDAAGFSSVVFTDGPELHAGVAAMLTIAAINALRNVFEGTA